MMSWHSYENLPHKMSERFSSLQTEPYSKYCEFASTTPSKLEIFTGLRRYNILYVKVSHTYILSMASGHDEFCLFHASSFQVLLYRDNAQKYLVARCQVLAVFFCFCKNILPLHLYILSVSVKLRS